MRASVLAFAILFAPAAAAQSYQPPRATDGHPDFGGVWGTTFVTPLERPDFAKSLVITPDQAKKFSADYIASVPPVVDPDFQIQGVKDVAKVNGEYRTSMIVKPDDGQLPFTDKGLKLALKSLEMDDTAFDNPEERPTFERCLAGMGQAPIRQLPGMIPTFIVQTRDNLLLVTEDVASLRVVHLDNRQPPPAVMSSFEGWSQGHWEGDTLVVVTTHSRKDDQFRELLGRPIIVTPDSKVVERFTRVSPTELLYQFTVEDPAIYAKPWLGEYVFAAQKTSFYEYACHEANYSLTNMLVAGRMGKQPKPKAKTN